MKRDLNSLKKELKRLADVDYVKKELNRLAREIKNFDLSQSLTPQTKARVEKLEARFLLFKAKLQDVQAKADATLEKFKILVSRARAATHSTQKSATKKASKKSSTKKAPATKKSSSKMASKPKPPSAAKAAKPRKN